MFDCAFKPAKGVRSIHYMGHIKMIGATQPFISGAISKTVNVPKDATVEEIEQAYIESWRLGAKAVSIYRDGSKRTQPLNTSRARTRRPRRISSPRRRHADPARKLPDERQAITHKFDIAGHEGYITVGLFEDGTPGEIFLVMAKEGSTISGFADAFAQAISYALQYGVPLQVLVDKFSHVRFEPSGMTQESGRPVRQVDRRLHLPLDGDQVPVDPRRSTARASTSRDGRSRRRRPPTPQRPRCGPPAAARPTSFAAIQNQEDAPPCSTCGSIMVRSGSCYKCANCGTTSGCA